jgi:hypothetical protein
MKPVKPWKTWKDVYVYSDSPFWHYLCLMHKTLIEYYEETGTMPLPLSPTN